MVLDPRTPVIVGVAQATQRPAVLAEAKEAVALMSEVTAAAAADAGSVRLLSRLDHVGVIAGAWEYSDPARLVASMVGATRARTSLSANGGNTPQSYLNAIASRIQSGELGSAVICGAETIWSRRRQRRADLVVSRTEQVDVEPDERFGAEVPMYTELEGGRGARAPIHFYPIFESAIRHARGETIEDHRDRVSALWQRFNAVAVNNPNGWTRTPMTAAEIRNASASNRMVGFPYTKAMNSNWDLDQAAALLICSAEVAQASGIARDRWVFPLAGTDAHDTYAVSERRDLHSSPAITAAGSRLFELGDTSVDDVAHIDLYSCFPSAVQVGAAALGIDESRQLTQTGGLTFAGGPLNNYVTHSIATMVGVLRGDPGSLGLVTANGGLLTKHALGLYSTEPSPTAYVAEDVQPIVDQVPKTEVDGDHIGDVTVEAYTVMHTADGPEVGLCAVRTPENRRTWGRVPEVLTLHSMMDDETIERSGHLGADGILTLL